MEFGKRKLKWYWLLLFIIYCGFVILELFNANPYLYSHNELRGALTTDKQKELKPFPTPPKDLRKVTEITWWPRWGPQHLATDTHSPPRHKILIEYKSHPIDFRLEDWDIKNVTSDASGFYVTGQNQWVVAIGLDGAVRWSFSFQRERHDDKPIHPALLDENTVYSIHPSGEVIALSKDSGALIWNLPLEREVVAQPFLWKEFIILPVNSAPDPEGAANTRPGVQWIFVSRANGSIIKTSEKIDVKPGFHVTYSNDLNQFFLNMDNKITALDSETLAPLWTQTLTDPIKDALTVNGSQIFVSTLGAKLVALDASKKGKTMWEADLLKPPAAQATFLPIMNKLSVPDESGDIHVLDAKTGKETAKANLEGSPQFADTWSARIKSQHIEEYKMDWLHKGWTIWTACSGKRLCILSPKGVLISKIALSGAPLALPVGSETKLSFLIQTGKHSYAVSELMDEKEIKRLKAEDSSEEASQSH
jgi:outer membrane protein assembly factor BamB